LKKTLLRTAALALVAAAAPAQSLGVRGAALARVPLTDAIAKDPEVLKAIRARNAANESKDEVLRKDREWTQNPKSPLRAALTGNACAARLRELIKKDANVVEVIVMDKSGANVCVSRETTDYWQGDEAKFQKTVGAGKALFIDEPAFDESTGVHSIQMSALIEDGGAAVGAVTVGLRLGQNDLVKP
jgi:hypothetical protein